MEGEFNFSDVGLPDHLPRLNRGAHREDSGGACAMEAAAWLAGEPWSDRPRSVHPVVAQVARTVNDSVSDDERQTLWPLIVASVDTARPRHPVLSMRLSRCAGKALAEAVGHGDLRKAWTAVLDEHARLYGEHPVRLHPRKRNGRLDRLTPFHL
jgi:hypothetical protein